MIWWKNDGCELIVFGGDDDGNNVGRDDSDGNIDINGQEEGEVDIDGDVL